VNIGVKPHRATTNLTNLDYDETTDEHR